MSLPIKDNLQKIGSILGKKKRALLVVVLFILILGLVFYYFLPQVANEDKPLPVIKDGVKMNTKEGGAEEYASDTNSPFGDIKMLPKIEPGEEFDEYEKALKGGNSYWDTWMWEDNIVYIQVKGVDPVSTEVTGYVGQPRSQSFSLKDILVNIECSDSNTVAIRGVAKEGAVAEIIKKDFNLFDDLKVGDLLITYCLDSECISAGKQCILVVSDAEYSL